MKKLFSILFVAVVTMCVMNSCSNEVTPVVDENAAYAQLSASVQNVNMKYSKALAINYATDSITSGPRRGWWKNFWNTVCKVGSVVGRIFTTLGADVLGSMSVGPTGTTWGPKSGIDASVAVWKLWDTKSSGGADGTTTPSKVAAAPSDSLVITINTDAIPALNGNLLEDNVGYVHNSVIVNLYNEYGDDLKNFDAETIGQLISDEYEKVIANAHLYTNLPVNNEIDLELVNHICDIIFQCEDVDTYIEVVETEYPQCKNEFEILKLAMEEIVNQNMTQEETDAYTADVLTEVDNSQISTDSKSVLKTTIGVTGASSQLWMPAE